MGGHPFGMPFASVFLTVKFRNWEHGDRCMNQRQHDPMRQGMIRSSIRMLIPFNKQREVLDILGSISDQIQFAPGCIHSRIYLGVDKVREIMIDDLWTNHEDMLRHLRSEAYRRVLLVVEMAEEPPEIRFDTILETSGVELIEKARIPS
jgi:quinol monooxygenase YgiN